MITKLHNNNDQQAARTVRNMIVHAGHCLVNVETTRCTMEPLNANAPLTPGSRSAPQGNRSSRPSMERQILSSDAAVALPVDQGYKLVSYSKPSARLPMTDSAGLLPLAVSPSEAALMARCSRGFLYKPMRTGELRSFKMGRSRKILYGDLVEWVNGLADRGLAG